MGHQEDHEHRYQTIIKFLNPYKMIKLICKIQDSSRFELGELSHISIKGTDICVGYLGDEHADIVDSHRPETRSMRKHLIALYNSV